MFAKLKKKIAEEAATAPRSGVRLPRTISKESITSVGADSGDEFASDGSSSRDDLPAQLLRRNNQIRKLEAKLSDFAEQLRIMQKTKEKLEIALENHQDCTYLSSRSPPSTSIKKLQEQNEFHLANRAKMAEGMTVALDEKDKEWMKKMAVVEKEKAVLSARLEDMMEQSFSLFQKSDDMDELESFQEEELAKVKHMLLKKEEQLGQCERNLQRQEAELHSVKRRLSEALEKLQALQKQHEEVSRLNTELEIEREELLLLREEEDKKIGELEGQNHKLQLAIHQVSADLEKSQSMMSSTERSLHDLQTEHNSLKLQQEKAAVTEEDKERLLGDLQKKVNSLERQLQGNLSQDDHLLELLQEKSILEQKLEETRAELLQFRKNHADTVSSLDAQVSRMRCNITELQTLLQHKDESSMSYRERTDTQIATLEQQIQGSCKQLKIAEEQIEVKTRQTEKLQGEWSAEKAFLDQQLSLLQQHTMEEKKGLEESITALQTDKCAMQETMTDLELQRDQANAVLGEQMEELKKCKVELDSQQTVCTEIAKALEESRQQRQELQTQVDVLTTLLQRSQQDLSTVTEKINLRERDIHRLRDELQTQQASLLQLREEFDHLRVQREQIELDKDSQLAHLREELLCQTQQQDTCQARISYLEVEIETLTEQLHSPAVCEEDHNGSVTVDDLHDVQKIEELEQQLSDKNRTIKQLQQRMAELKRTLQKELKLKPEPEEDAKEKLTESVVVKQEMVCAELPDMSSPSLSTKNTTVTNTSDLDDSREINFEYLKHVVLKFMSSRETEAYQLIRAVSVLLNFTHEEEDMLKQTLEYKMSWFGSKPSLKGIIRPSVSGSSTQWS
ncbi:golgin subfamily A member 1 isoform X1 [Syngnathoides biaculeatus]|uniref:golgin subfamily A member 1 isoform X1 n=1 Tax=Syngnathoides biaculeatus TaxID=300417 RepID=UPI002ADD4D18|nr:golgin subfamily A member 1 isoform X1 [Syngnathoides biaculeatus]